MPKRCLHLPRPDRRRLIGALAAAPFGLAAVFHGEAAAAPGFDLAALTALLARVKSGQASFTETRRIEMLDRTLESKGTLSFRAPDSFVRETLSPRREKLAVSGNTLTMSLGERSRTMQLDASPEASVIVEAVRGTLLGNRELLERLFDASVTGTAGQWALDLVPRDLRLRGQVASVRVSGREQVVREVAVLLADGDRSVMTITPASAVTTIAPASAAASAARAAP